MTKFLIHSTRLIIPSPNIKLDPVLAQDVTPEIPTNVVTIELIKERWKARFSVASFQNELDHSAA
eukprot:CAMPEP_0178942610 /NCGR_PEP_ID=MMETSP0789-20121207/2092_1 /TAXON_ID=3005 /ORGANISM="Rhizosolenia setigera, Strain CCMP 1694" /LENGTH=64 /DNA_ID=CAMNT_0020622043 /DNA_START=607 /DNA_END=797 /DNA_ORIENTATION=-